jgi:phosphatidylethanolamine-binding protein (PEBP) family uncharacterized protein
MHSFLTYVELSFSYMFSSNRGHDAKLFTRQQVFAGRPATIQINSPDVGVSGSRMLERHTGDGADDFPELSWEPVEGAAEYILISEDPDAPVWFVPCHGLYYKLPGNTTSVSAADFKVKEAETHTLQGGFKYGKNILRSVYGGPKPLLNHGEHRYFYELVALKEPIEEIGTYPSKEDFLKKLAEKDLILGWGEWVGTYERKLD